MREGNLRTLEDACPLWISIFAVNEAWSIVTIPGWVSGAIPAAVIFTEKTSPAWSDGTFGTRAEYPEGAVAVSHVEIRCWEGRIYLKDEIYALRGRVASQGRSRAVACWRRCAVAEGLVHNVHGCP